MDISQIVKSVLAVVKPTKDEIVHENANIKVLLKQLKRSVPKNAEVVLTGSIAKNTFLRMHRDIDVFILFPLTIRKEKFEQLIKKIVLRAFSSAKYELKYTEHPYLRLYLKDRRIDVVPAYKIKSIEQRKSAVDRSILHTEFILKKLKKKQIDDVLLLKKFFQSNEVYGAEIEIEGFSGYLCELLIIYYKNFMNALRQISKWEKPIFIDIQKHYTKKSEIENVIKRFNAQLVVVDPIDKDRNVAAAVSKETLNKSILIANRFLQKPSLAFFFATKKTFDEKIISMKKRNGVIYILKARKPNVVNDILWGQIKKLSRSITNYLKEKEFVVRDIILHSDDKILYLAFLLKEECLPETRIMKGPKTNMPINIKYFKSAHKSAKIFRKGKHLFALVKRDISTARVAFKKFFRTAVLPSHFQNIKFVIERKADFLKHRKY